MEGQTKLVLVWSELWVLSFQNESWFFPGLISVVLKQQKLTRFIFLQVQILVFGPNIFPYSILVIRYLTEKMPVFKVRFQAAKKIQGLKKTLGFKISWFLVHLKLIIRMWWFCCFCQGSQVRAMEDPDVFNFEKSLKSRRNYRERFLLSLGIKAQIA